MKHQDRGDRKRMGRASAGLLQEQPPGGAVSRETGFATANTAIRRYGYIGAVMFEALVAASIREGHQREAEELGNQLKPLIDALCHFTLELELEHDTETDHEIPQEK